MILRYGKRNTGKTTNLIKVSAEMNIPILCYAEWNVDYIKKLAKQMNLSIPKPISILTTYIKNPDQLKYVKDLLIDDAEKVLEIILDAKIHAMVLSKE